MTAMRKHRATVDTRWMMRLRPIAQRRMIEIPQPGVPKTMNIGNMEQQRSLAREIGSMSSRLSLASILLCAPLLAQGITFVEGASTQSLDVHILPEGGIATDTTLLMQGVEFLSIEMSGRVASQDLQTDATRREERNGMTRLELPGGRRIFSYRRHSGQAWGFLLVEPTGNARIALELPGIGTAGTASPFADRIAIDRQGTHLCVVGTMGGMHVVRLDGTNFASTGSPVRFVPTPSAALPSALMVGATHAFFVSANGRMWRMPLADLGLPTDCTPAGTATSFAKDEIALSGDGTKAVFLHGPSNSLLRLYMLDSANAPVLLPPPASKYEEPGYLPEGTGDLRLMLNHDGSRLFYIDGVIRDESHLLDTTGALGDLQVTQDAIFQPYIGIHILPSFKGNQLIASIGDPNRMDWFVAELSATGNTVRNATGTGSLAQPFTSGSLIPSKLGMAGGRALISDVSPLDSTRQTLRLLDLQTATTTVLHQDLDGPIVAGASTGATPDLVVPGPGDRLYNGSTGALIAAAPAGIQLDAPVAGEWFRAAPVRLTPDWSTIVIYLPDGSTFFGPTVHRLRQTAITHQNLLVMNSDQGIWTVGVGLPQTLAPLSPPPAIRIVLSGAAN